MGNCPSEHHAKLFRTENFSNDPSAFRVFVKKKNKFIPGWLKINDEEIVFTRGMVHPNNLQFWPLAYLRRYGYTCSGIFFFESGRRCATGEGLHTFQSHQAEKIFQVVQGKIKIEEYARGSRASSVVSSNRTNLINNSSRIHPVQRFCSEGSGNEFRGTASPSIDSNYSVCPPSRPLGAPPPYETYQRSLQEALNRRLCAANSGASTITNNCGNLMSASAIATNSSLSGGGYAPPPSGMLMCKRQRSPSSNSNYSVNVIQPIVNGNNNFDPKNSQIFCAQRERPRSVVSALEHGVCNVSNKQTPIFMQMPNNNIGNDAVDDRILSLQQQQQLLNNSAMFESFNSSAMMDRSYNSSVNGGRYFTSSPWSSQQQLEGEIVLEHVLSKNTRKYHQQQLHCGELPPLGGKFLEHAASDYGAIGRAVSGGVCGSASSTAVPNLISSPPPSNDCSDTNSNGVIRQRKYHSYVNIDLSPRCGMTGGYGSASSSSLNAKILAARELHRTSKSRQEFLSSQPGGFTFSNARGNFNPIMNLSICSSVNSDLPPRNFQSPIAQNDASFSNDIAQHHPPHSAFTSVINNNKNSTESAQLRKRIPPYQMSINNNVNESSHIFGPQVQQQNYSPLNPTYALQPNGIGHFANSDGTNNAFNLNQNPTNFTDLNAAKTNYALIDFNKTKALETATNNKQQKDEKAQQQQSAPEIKLDANFV